MRLRWALWIALLLSVGVNLGVLIALRRPPQGPPPPAPAPQEVPTAAREPEAAPAPRAEPVEPAAEPAPARPPEPRRELGRGPVAERHLAPIEPEPERERLPPPEHEAPAGAERAPRFDRVADELQLRADQRPAFFELQRRHFEQVRQTRAALEGVRARLAQEFLSGSADRGRVETLLAEAKGHQNELDNLLARMLLESQQILTPEQQRRFSFLVLQRLRAEGPGRMGPRGGGEAPLRRRPLMRRPPNG